jgi:hypothetical protein
MKKRAVWGLFLISISFAVKVEARPEYAVRYNNNSCTSCHFSPVGGGPLNYQGKLFQNRWFKNTPIEIQKYVSAKFMQLGYVPESQKTSSGGLGLMSGSLAVHVPLAKDESSYLVIDNNLAGFAAAPLRDSYVLYKFEPKKLYNWFDTLLVGRFRAPFGLATEEHRTYTRMQTGTRWFDFENGILLSGNPSSKLHYDFGLVNGKNFSGQSLNPGQADQWATILNIRYMPGFVMFGSSLSHYKTNDAYSSSAWTLYSLISFARWNYSLVPASLKLEYAEAKGFNSILNQGNASDPAYVNSILGSRSKGILARLDWLLTKKLTLVYKYDWLTPDMDFPIDIYERHGLGFRWSISPYTFLTMRSEIARATHPSESVKVGQLSQNANFLILEASF